MSVTGIETTATHPPRLARELKQRIEDLFHRYAFEEVIAEIARQKPKFDIHISSSVSVGRGGGAGMVRGEMP
jgi:hypothetical protein